LCIFCQIYTKFKFVNAVEIQLILLYRSADNINISYAEYLLLIDLAAEIESCMYVQVAEVSQVDQLLYLSVRDKFLEINIMLLVTKLLQDLAADLESCMYVHVEVQVGQLVDLVDVVDQL
jgi:hypothetical protein